MSNDLLDGATQEIERLNKIARQFEDQVARLTRENDELRKAAKNVVDCFGCGGDPQRMADNLVPHIGLLAALIGDERATKALNTEKDTG